MQAKSLLLFNTTKGERGETSTEGKAGLINLKLGQICIIKQYMERELGQILQVLKFILLETKLYKMVAIRSNRHSAWMKQAIVKENARKTFYYRIKTSMPEFKAGKKIN